MCLCIERLRSGDSKYVFHQTNACWRIKLDQKGNGDGIVIRNYGVSYEVDVAVVST